MGHRHSKKFKSPPEVTEIIELNDNSDMDRQSSISSAPPVVPEEIRYPPELRKVIENVEAVERSLGDMSDSQINLYYATFKDDLHNNWQKVYSVRDATVAIKDKKIETIERIKKVLKRLNDHVLKKSRHE